MNEEKQTINIKKDNENFKWMQTECDMVFYNYENKQNFPLIINFPKLNSNNQNNINVYNKQSTTDFTSLINQKRDYELEKYKRKKK